MSVSTNDLVSPWHPITDAILLKTLGKLLEELGELTAATARCVIQGVYEAEPITGKVNIEWLRDEVADVLANIDLVCEVLDITPDHRRILRKKANLRKWHAGAWETPPVATGIQSNATNLNRNAT